MSGLSLKRIIKFTGSILVLMFASQVLLAAGTQANSVINNTAVINYDLVGVPMTVSASTTVTVDELIDVNVTWQDGANISVMSPSSIQVLTFLATNTGNGVEDFILSIATPNPSPQFDPINIQVWEDTDGDSTFNPTNDTQITLGATINLDGGDPANDSRLVFVVSDIPASLAVGDLGNVDLIATSSTANANSQVGNVAATIVNGGDGGAIDAIVGNSGAQNNALGVYEVVPSIVTITKSSEVLDSRGNNLPYPGSIIRYTLTVNVIGTDPVNNLVISDVIPVNTTYNAAVDSINLDGVLQTNADDIPTDYTNFNSGSNTITVDLSEAGTIAIVPPATITITFDVTIN